MKVTAQSKEERKGEEGKVGGEEKKGHTSKEDKLCKLSHLAKKVEKNCTSVIPRV